MHTDYGNLKVVLSWMALFFADSARQDLLRFSSSFHIFSLGPFGVRWCGVRWLVFAGRVEDEIRPQWVAQRLRLPGALVVEPVDQSTTQEFPM